MARKSLCVSFTRLQSQIDSLRATVASLEARLASAQKDPRTPSKPPASDLVKPPPPPPPEGKAKRCIGGQPGNARDDGRLVGQEMLNGSYTYVAEICPDCGHGLRPLPAAPHIVQQLDIESVPISIVQHQALAEWWPQCKKIHYAALPSAVEKGGLVGPRLTTLIAYLKGACHASYSTVRKFLRDVVGVTISRGQLAKVIGKVSEALDAPYEALLENLTTRSVLNVDETGHPENAEQWWTCCFDASLYTVFKIDPTRSADVLMEVLGKEFDGVLGCDYFSAYRRYYTRMQIAH